MNNQLNSNVGSESNAVSEYALVAAEWWAKAIANPTHDTEDMSRTGEFISKLLTLQNMLNPITPEQIELFKKALIPLIEEECETRGILRLCVSYNPDLTPKPDFILARAAKEAGIEDACCFQRGNTMFVSASLILAFTIQSETPQKLWSIL